MPRSGAAAFVLALATAPCIAAAAPPSQAVAFPVVIGFEGGVPADAAERVAAHGGRVLAEVPAIGLVVADPGSRPGFLTAVRAEPGVRYAALDGRVRLASDPNPLSPNPPTDPYWPAQWGPHRIDATGAWATERGRGEVVVAVLDTGVLATHPDLVESCVPRCMYGPEDGHGHGTHVAGIVAAEANNKLGIAGVAPGVSILSLKVMSDGGGGLWSTVSAGIVAATDLGADVITMSLWGWCDRSPETCQPLADAAAYADAHGVVLVAAAGNAYCTPCVAYPARLPQVIAVGALAPDDQVAIFSGGGPELDLSAPGVDVLGTMVPGSVLGVLACAAEPDPFYCRLSGTSMAAPHVAGAAALLRSRCPGLAPGDVRGVLVATADDLGPPGFDGGTGWGRVNLARAVASAPC